MNVYSIDGVAVRLLGDRLAAILELDHAEQDDGEHDQPDDAGDQEHPPLQVLDRLGVVAGRLPGVLRRVLCARREPDGGGDAGDETHAMANAGGTFSHRGGPCFLVGIGRGAHGTTTSSVASVPGTVNS